MPNVLGGVAELFGTQGASQPIRTRLVLRHLDPEELPNERCVPEAVAEPGQGGGNLGVEQGLGKRAERVRKGLEVFPGRMHELFAPAVGEHPDESGRARQSQGIDEHRAPAAAKLDERELGVEAPLPLKLAVQRDLTCSFCEKILDFPFFAEKVLQVVKNRCRRPHNSLW